ncbi:hypothetical protein PENSPDRAFT_693802 [Peniophora sp. CONT]|nr:hypothetical protein PENSPDRAFT_693802 [Peniophora sp. CONT]
MDATNQERETDRSLLAPTQPHDSAVDSGHSYPILRPVAEAIQCREHHLLRLDREQRRRDGLRDVYDRLKCTLSINHANPTKIQVLQYATTRIQRLEATHAHLEGQLAQLEQDVRALRSKVLNGQEGDS